MSWSSRQLETLTQRVEVLRLFATSMLWYKASALPLPIKYAKKFESAMVRFLWIGRLEKLKIDEVKNPLLSGGLNLPCVISKSDSLFLSQTCRLLSDPSSRQYSHIKYWLGLYIGEYFPDMRQCPHGEIITPYFQHMKALLVGGFMLKDIEPTKLHLVTAKKLYQGFTTTFPPPKVTFKYFDFEWSQVWERLQDPVLDSMARDIIFMIIHNIVANKERVNRFNMAPSPNCPECDVVQDNVHLFCECVLVREAWFWLRQRILEMLPPDGGSTSNFELLNLMFMSGMFDSEIVWLIGIHVKLVWVNVMSKKKSLDQIMLKSECELKFFRHLEANLPLTYICAIYSSKSCDSSIYEV